MVAPIGRKFWEENLTGKEDLFEFVNMKNCGRRKVMKHKEIKGSEKYVTLISLCFLTLQLPQFFMFTDRNKSSLPVNFSSQNVFRLEQP